VIECLDMDKCEQCSVGVQFGEHVLRWMAYVCR